MSYIEKVTVEINGLEYLADVNFDKEPFIPAELFGLPEHCHEASGGEITINTLTLIEDPKGKKIKRNFNDFIDDLYESIIEQLED